MNKLMGLIILPIFVLGCSSTGTKSNSSNYDSTRYFSVKDAKVKSGQCPRSDKSWLRQNSKQLLDIAKSCVLEKNWSQVDAIGEQLAGLEPESPWGAYFMSIGSMESGKYPRSLWMADLALKKAPKLGFLHYQKGRILWAMGEFELSVTNMEQSLKYDGELNDAHMFLGQVYFRDREYKKSISHFKSALKNQPSLASAQIGLAESYYQMKDYRAAIQSFENAVSVAPNDLQLRLRLGEIYESEKMLNEALASYRKARELARRQRNPSNELNINVSDKIELLEKMVQPTPEGKKLSQDDVGAKKRSK